MILVCIIADWSVFATLFLVILTFPSGTCCSILHYEALLSNVALNIYLMYLKQSWSVLRFFLMHNNLYGITCNLPLLMGFREKRMKAMTDLKWEVWRHWVSSHCNQKQERGCYSKRCSRKELLSPFHWHFVQPGHIPAPALQCSRVSPAVPSAGYKQG